MTTPPDSDDLQFDSVVPRTDAAAPPPLPATTATTTATTQCTLCQASIAGEYYDVNGHTVCRACSEKVSREATTPHDAGTLVRALVAGGVAAVLGALVYFAVIAVSGFEIGLVAIAIGYMVGYGVRLGTRGRGGRRFQVIAVLLTYFAVGLAYSSLAIKELLDKPEGDTAAVSATQAGDAAQPSGDATEASALEASDEGDTTGGGLALAFLQLLAFTFVLPVVVVAGSMPGGIISAAIIGFGMMQAWKMTAAPAVTVSGPYRLAAPAAD
jgi:hypothetical protein